VAADTAGMENISKMPFY